MKLIKTVDAEGAVLCHDITQIIKGVTKDAVFRKGHVVTKEDIPVLLSVGMPRLLKNSTYVSTVIPYADDLMLWLIICWIC